MPVSKRKKFLRRFRSVAGKRLDSRTVVVSADDIWTFKRHGQRQDITGLETGALSFEDVSWFTGGVARNAKLPGSLF